MIRLLRKSLAFFIKDFLTSVSYRMAFFGQLVFTFLTIAAFYFLSKLFQGARIEMLAPYGGQYFPFVLVGVALSSYLGVAMRSFSDNIRTAQVLGTLEAMVATPTPISQIVMMSTIFSFASTSLRVVMTLVLGAVVFGVEFQHANWPGAMLVLLLTIISFSFLGIFSAGIVLAFKRGDPSSFLVQGLSFLIGGVYYPISVLPEWAQDLAKLLPITHALHAMRRLLLQDARLSELTDSLLGLFLFCCIAAPLSLGTFLSAVRKVKKEGSLSHF